MHGAFVTVSKVRYIVVLTFLIIYISHHIPLMHDGSPKVPRKPTLKPNGQSCWQNLPSSSAYGCYILSYPADSI